MYHELDLTSEEAKDDMIDPRPDLTQYTIPIVSVWHNLTLKDINLSLKIF